MCKVIRMFQSFTKAIMFVYLLLYQNYFNML